MMYVTCYILLHGMFQLYVICFSIQYNSILHVAVHIMVYRFFGYTIKHMLHITWHVFCFSIIYHRILHISIIYSMLCSVISWYMFYIVSDTNRQIPIPMQIQIHIQYAHAHTRRLSKSQSTNAQAWFLGFETYGSGSPGSQDLGRNLGYFGFRVWHTCLKD